jgi:hypothetical protein
MANRLAVAMTGSHLGTGVTKVPVVLQSLLDGIGWFSLAFEVVWMVLLRTSDNAQCKWKYAKLTSPGQRL